MPRLLLWAGLPVSLLLFTFPGCGGSATDGAGSGGQAGVEATGGKAATGGRAATGGVGSNAGGASGVCNLQQTQGGCTAYIPSFWHNPQTHECEPFVYGGCGGNANRFESLAACLATCGVDACDRASDCALTSECCGPCEPLEMTDLTAINQTHLAKRRCDKLCGACPSLGVGERETRNYFLAGCVAHKCRVIDIRGTPMTPDHTELVRCADDSDCKLRLGAQCCEACSGEPIAVNGNANFCPDGAVTCPACAPRIPPGYSTSCVQGRCVLSEPAVP